MKLYLVHTHYSHLSALVWANDSDEARATYLKDHRYAEVSDVFETPAVPPSETKIVGFDEMPRISFESEEVIERENYLIEDYLKAYSKKNPERLPPLVTYKNREFTILLDLGTTIVCDRSKLKEMIGRLS